MAASGRSRKSAALGKYRKKRSFAETPEPAGKRGSKSGRSYVIQEHHARSHHFDFRLEMNGVLVSWAVPRGMPASREEKRLAVHVEDHPLEYGSFEGEIPEGNYGAGTVTIWDSGEWLPKERAWKKSFSGGKLKFFLRGGRLQGEYLLVKSGEEPNWLLRKLSDEAPAKPVEQLDREKPAFIPFQLARVVSTVPEGDDWIHEIKLDGYRIQAVKTGKTVKLYTRNGHDWTDRFGTLATRIGKLSTKDFILDGEAVVHDKKGRTSFGLLQEALGVRGKKRSGAEISFVCFDILHHNGVNLRPLPLSERLKWLDRLSLEDKGPLRRSKTWPAENGPELFREACRLGLEGVISKKLTQPYAPDRREWSKSKCRPRQEFIVCGYLPPKSSLPAFSSLVLGTLENNRLVPRGKVGTGFKEDERRSLLKKLNPLKTSRAAFDIEDRKVVWVSPELVVEVEYAEITRDGSIRQGCFIALREDKGPREVHLDGIRSASAHNESSKVCGIVISNPDRVVFPSDGITKIEVASYFERVGELMMPFLIRKPLAVLRAPEGLAGQQFFQKSFPTHLPRHVYQRTLDDGTEIFTIRNVKGLVSLAQFGVIEIHPWGAPLPQGDKPDSLIWDLDPDASVPWVEVKGAAILLRDFLAERGLDTIVKTSGGKGLHVILPVKKQHGWDVLKPFTKEVARQIASLSPQQFTITASKAKRSGKIYIDWLRNGRGATCIAPWCVRARPGAPVSMPISWSDLRSLQPAGFSFQEPPQMPSDWTNIVAQKISKAVIKDLGL
ncbi:DNA ligase D [Luteolibacter flavescens]|uniref:DNA ligase (ATP) n=1 Tax=Luteolibacter flavescens TaxID=1859460 RepID=A0ABT3FR13_9BACT|nr:DNA ligase D [Luteolibacter flavescens]MCW1886013.1 DNA ligase D [Luteolibacter flavescens]